MKIYYMMNLMTLIRYHKYLNIFFLKIWLKFKNFNLGQLKKINCFMNGGNIYLYTALGTLPSTGHDPAEGRAIIPNSKRSSTRGRNETTYHTSRSSQCK